MLPFIPIVLLAHGSGLQSVPAAYARTCLDAAQSRAAIAELKLANPAAIQRAAAEHIGGGDFLRSRLCRWNEEYIYEITLLSRDGKVAQVYLRAVDGQIVGKNGE